MSGHSKWANIRVKKTAQDARRGKVFTRHARLIEIAARAGGGDPVTNNALRTAVENARAENVPNANIERAIKKGTGALQGEQMAEVLYAAFGPGDIACLIECLTDNRNRTLNNLKMIMHKRGGAFSESASVAWMFRRCGVVVVRCSLLVSGLPEDIELHMIELGVDDIEVNGDTISVTMDAAHWTRVRDFLKEKGYEVLEAGLHYLPTQTVAVHDAATAHAIAAFVEALEEDDDVVDVFMNAELPDA